jgi:hypothetical protein
VKANLLAALLGVAVPTRTPGAQLEKGLLVKRQAVVFATPWKQLPLPIEYPRGARESITLKESLALLGLDVMETEKAIWDNACGFSRVGVGGLTASRSLRKI